MKRLITLLVLSLTTAAFAQDAGAPSESSMKSACGHNWESS